MNFEQNLLDFFGKRLIIKVCSEMFDGSLF